MRVTSDNMNKEMDVNIALAGVCQAAALVQQIARKGQAEELAFKTSIESIVITESQNTEQVFGSLPQLKLGFQTLESQLSSKAFAKDAEITRYVASVLSLERKLSRNAKMMDKLGERLEQVQRQQLHFELFDAQMQENLASVYSDIVSPVGAKIQVAGEPAQLKQPLVQHKIRALLLAAVRAAVLWRQLGGKRRHILFNRTKILASTEKALQLISNSH